MLQVLVAEPTMCAGSIAMVGASQAPSCSRVGRACIWCPVFAMKISFDLQTPDHGSCQRCQATQQQLISSSDGSVIAVKGTVLLRYGFADTKPFKLANTHL